MTRKRIAFALAAVVLVAGVVAGRERPTLEILPERPLRAAAAPADDGINLERLRRGESASPQSDPFARKNFAPAESPRPVVAETRPVAPPLPFQYFGRLTENGNTEVFVMRGDELLSIAAGQKLGEYRVDEIGPSRIAFTYLPLKTKQTLDLP